MISTGKCLCTYKKLHIDTHQAIKWLRQRTRSIFIRFQVRSLEFIFLTGNCSKNLLLMHSSNVHHKSVSIDLSFFFFSFSVQYMRGLMYANSVYSLSKSAGCQVLTIGSIADFSEAKSNLFNNKSANIHLLGFKSKISFFLQVSAI